MVSPFISHLSIPHASVPYQAIIEDFLIKRGGSYKSVNDSVERIKYFAYNEPNVKIPQPKYCAFEFMSESELQEFLKIEDESGMKQTLGKYNKSFLSFSVHRFTP